MTLVSMDNQLKTKIGNNFENTELGIFRIKRNLELLDLSKSDVVGIEAHQTSIWVNQNGNWQMLHHQGTVCA